MDRLIDFSEKDKWEEIIKSFKCSDVYFMWGYANAFQIHGDGTPVLFYYEDENGRAANVFFLRDISNEKCFKGRINPGKYFDIRSVYGYGGLLYEGSDLGQLISDYSKVFARFCKSNNIICEFVRFNTLIKNHKYLSRYYNIIPARKTVYMDLSKGEKYIWDNLKSENRTRIRKAIKSGIEIIKGRDEELVENFIDIYIKTMDRDGASPYYYFGKEFFNATLHELPENSMIFAAKLNGRIIAASLVLFNEQYAHYHLGGSDKEYMNLAPNNLLFYEIAKWGCNRGIKKFHLGGGYASEDDNLFKFKKTFSKLEPLVFYIGTKIYNEMLYEYLIEVRKKSDMNFDNTNKYFPKYRG